MNWKVFGVAWVVMVAYCAGMAALAGGAVLIHHLTGSTPITAGVVAVVFCSALAALLGATWDRP